ncbi:MAG: hypothetical protein C0506_03965 [Anaerolinea sp.]|nr:hypothetical protein [Anaerolinea sp.]
MDSPRSSSAWNKQPLLEADETRVPRAEYQFGFADVITWRASAKRAAGRDEATANTGYRRLVRSIST